MTKLELTFQASENVVAKIDEIISNNLYLTVDYSIQKDQGFINVLIKPYYEEDISEWSEFVSYFTKSISSLY